jgi:PrtD family type I secretion system ABC transporter
MSYLSRDGLTPDELAQALRNCRYAFGVCLVFSLVINVLMLASPIYMLQVYDRILTTGHIETLVMLTLVVVLTIVIMSILDGLRAAVMNRVGCWLNDRLGPVLLACGVRGRLQGEANGAQPLRDLSQIQNFIGGHGLTAFFDAPWVPIYIALIWMLHPILGMVAIASAILLLLLSFANEMATRRAIDASTQAQIRATIMADLAIRNADVVTAMGMLPALTRRWQSLNKEAMEGMRKSGDIAGIIMSVTKFVRLFVQIAVLGLGAYLALKSQLTAGGMIAASILLGRALAPVEIALGAWRGFMDARFAYGRLQRMIRDYPAEPERTRLPAPTGQLLVSNVTYIAPRSNQVLLNNVSFAADPGETIAIIGPSGAGKSTLCRLIVGIGAPSMGEIRIDGSPLHHWNTAQLSSHIGFLPQDVEVFSGTVRENIARMRNVPDEEVVKAAIQAHAHDMIQNLPQGYDTQIGDAGIRLSGGQRQRIGLARAVFGTPRLIVLDEPNANLDQAGESALAAAISNLKNCGAVLVIVGHRASTLALADKILVLKDGCAVMFGPSHEIMQRMSALSHDGDSTAVPLHKTASGQKPSGNEGAARLAHGDVS